MDKIKAAWAALDAPIKIFLVAAVVAILLGIAG